MPEAKGKVFFSHGSFFVGMDNGEGKMTDLHMIVPAGEGRVAWLPAGLGFSQNEWTVNAQGQLEAELNKSGQDNLDSMIKQRREQETGIVIPSVAGFGRNNLRNIKG